MKIEGLPPGSGGIREISTKKPSKTTPAETPKEFDTVAITGSKSREEIAGLSLSAPVEFPVRREKLDIAAGRISRDEYNTPEIREKTAEHIVDFLTAPDTSSRIRKESMDSPQRTERTESAQARAGAGYYDRPEILSAVAERLAEALGLDRIPER